MASNHSSAADASPRLLRQLSPLGVWALSFGCAVGWGAFVMPGNTFLPIAGPLGTALGIALGALVMFIIGVNYHFLIQKYPDAGGTYSYAGKTFGYDHGFLASWFLCLVYLAIIWANATAIPLIFRSLFGDLLHFGFHYYVAGYEVWCGEILISLAAELLFGLLCLRGTRVSSVLQIVMALLLAVGVAAAAVIVFVHRASLPELKPAPLFSSDYKPAVGVLFIVFLAPWAYAGFESVSHSTEEFRFRTKKALPIMAVALLTSAAVYILLALVGASAQPEGFSDWQSYLKELGSQSGLAGIPVFFAGGAAGPAALILLGLAAAGGIITGFVSNLTAASRMIYAMARDELLPKSFSRLNPQGAPRNALLFLLLVSLPIPFLGRSAIGWIIDVNTVGVVIAYAYTSAAAFRSCKGERHPLVRITGALGVAVSVFFLFYFLIPNFSSVASFSTESYLILLLWSVLGFVVFYLLFRRDRSERLGRITLVWVVLLLMIFFSSFVWLSDTTQAATDAGAAALQQEYADVLRTDEAAASGELLDALGSAAQQHLNETNSMILRNTIFQFLLILLSLALIFRIYGTVRKRGQTAVAEKHVAEESSRAKTTFLSNMSHDIRTPMNAIIGYVTLAKREKNLPPRVGTYLNKIEASSEHLLALINDVLELSRVESGRMELMPVPGDLVKLMGEVRDLFSTQMEEKGLVYRVECLDLTDRRILCDLNRMNRVLLNLISNAYKFTPKGGEVMVTLRQTGRGEGTADYELSVRDTGIGMSPEFAARVFEAYARERTQTVENIQGTGLGTAITKGIVDLMGGTIEVKSEQGKGSEFIVRVSMQLDPEAKAAGNTDRETVADGHRFDGVRLLLAEDDPANREVEKTLLEDAGFLVDLAKNGEEAVEMLAGSEPGEYAAVLLDVEMPVKNGYEVARLIRSLKNKTLAEVPIVAVTAKAYSEDVAAALESGMNAHISKPVSMKKIIDTMSELLG